MSSSKSKSKPHPQLPERLTIQVQTPINPQPGPHPYPLSRYFLPTLLRSSSMLRTLLPAFHWQAQRHSLFCTGRQVRPESDGYHRRCSARCPGISWELVLDEAMNRKREMKLVSGWEQRRVLLCRHWENRMLDGNASELVLHCMYSDLSEWDLKELQNRVRENLASTLHYLRRIF
jgi:hypothetical protein